ncbi:putative endopolygalacturonase, partial [Hortaea werneckii]
MPSVSSALALALALGQTAVQGSPVAPMVTPPPNPADVQKRADSCTFSGSNGASSASASQGSCSTIVLSDIAVPSGETLKLNDLEDGTHVIFEGTTTFGYEEWDGPLIRIAGTDITVTGAEGNLIDGDGSRWWDGEGTNGGVDKPKFFYAHKLHGDSIIKGLNIKNTPVQAISVNDATGLTIQDVTIDNTDGDGNGGHNTDCYDVSESDSITIKGAVCKNQDDCLAINSGSNIAFTGGQCSGGHGISIGSVGGRDNNTVAGVNIEDSSVEDSTNGIRIKTISGEEGTVSGITYKDVTMSGITKYGIKFEQDYENGSPTGTPTDGVPITDVTLNGVTGSVTDDAERVY